MLSTEQEYARAVADWISTRTGAQAHVVEAAEDVPAASKTRGAEKISIEGSMSFDKIEPALERMIDEFEQGEPAIVHVTRTQPQADAFVIDIRYTKGKKS